VSCTFQGGTTGNTFTLDDFTFDPTSEGRIPPGANPRAPSGPMAVNQSFMCVRSGQLVPFGYFLTGWTRRDECSSTCPPGYICMTTGMNAFTLKHFVDKPLGYRMSVCFYDEDAVLNEYPLLVGQHWRTDKIRLNGPKCSYSTGSVSLIVANWTGTQRDITRDR